MMPPLNASDEVWLNFLRSLSAVGLLDVWCWAADAGHQRVKDFAVMVIGCRALASVARSRLRPAAPQL